MTGGPTRLAQADNADTLGSGRATIGNGVGGIVIVQAGGKIDPGIYNQGTVSGTVGNLLDIGGGGVVTDAGIAATNVAQAAMFAGTNALLAAAPVYPGQIAVESLTGNLYLGVTTNTGDWTPQVAADSLLFNGSPLASFVLQGGTASVSTLNIFTYAGGTAEVGAVLQFAFPIASGGPQDVTVGASPTFVDLHLANYPGDTIAAVLVNAFGGTTAASVQNVGTNATPTFLGLHTAWLASSGTITVNAHTLTLGGNLTTSGTPSVTFAGVTNGGTATMPIGTTTLVGTGGTATNGTGGTITDIIVDGLPFRVHAFSPTASGSFTFTAPSTGVPGGKLEGLAIGSGGGAGCRISGGAGGGGVLAFTYAVAPSQSITVVIGARGIGEPFSGATSGHGTNGGNTTFDGTNIVAYGGGYGGDYDGIVGGNGGCGGAGGGYHVTAPGTGTNGQGFSGGLVSTNTINIIVAPGGGGAGGKGHDTAYYGFASAAGDGGIGTLSAITGTPTWYGGGGGGSAQGYYINGKGGLGGGGDGAWVASGPSGNGGDGVDGLGGGGGGAVSNDTTGTNRGGNGGLGALIVRYRM